MLYYLLEVSLCWLGFYVLYAVFLSKETFHQLNRSYLLGTLVLGLIVPILEFPVSLAIENTTAEYYLQTITIGIEQMNEAIVISATETNLAPNLNALTILLWVYFLGVLIGLMKLVYGMWQVLSSTNLEMSFQNMVII